MQDAAPPPPEPPAQVQSQPQQQEPPGERSMPVATPEKPEAPKAEGSKGPPPESPPSGMGFLATVGLGLTGLSTDLSGGHEGSFAGSAFGHLVGSGFSSGGFSYSARLGALLGGGSAGMESLFSARVFVGAGGIVGDHSQIFFRVGAEGTSLKNDEIEASTMSIPAAQLGYQIWMNRFGFELAPRIGLAPRTEYEPGDESLGRRHWRKIGTRASAGGSALISIGDLFAIDAGYTRIVDDEPVDHFDGRACLAWKLVALCGIGQYWKSIATLPTGGAAAQEIPTMYIGGSFGVGETRSGHDKIF